MEYIQAVLTFVAVGFFAAAGWTLFGALTSFTVARKSSKEDQG